jgi:hypothetical protein
VLTQTGQILGHVPGHSTHTDANGTWIAGTRLQGTLGPPLGIQASRSNDKDVRVLHTICEMGHESVPFGPDENKQEKNPA